MTEGVAMESKLPPQEPERQKNPDEKFDPQPPSGSREAHERALDKTLADSFPASDPLSSIPDPSVPDPVSEDPKAA
jgi:hypothetical protein